MRQGVGSSEIRVRLRSITSPPVGTTFHLRFKRIQPNPPAFVGIGADGQGFAVFDTLEREAAGVEHEAGGTEVGGGGVVLAQVAVVGVADDGMEDVFHGAAQLVFAACVRDEFCPRVARGRVAGGGLEGQFGARKTAVLGLGFLEGGFGLGFGDFVGLIFEGVVDESVVRQISAHDCPIGFACGFLFELLCQQAGGFGVEGKQEDAGCRAVEAVGGINVLSDLVAQGLHDELCFVAVEPASVDEHSGRFVDGDGAAVAVENFEHGLMWAEMGDCNASGAAETAILFPFTRVGGLKRTIRFK